MEIRRITAQSVALEDHYGLMVTDPRSSRELAELGRRMLDLLFFLSAIDGPPVWAATSHAELHLVSTDDYRQPSLVTIEGRRFQAGFSYCIEYPMHDSEAPWPGARVLLGADDVLEACEMVAHGLRIASGFGYRFGSQVNEALRPADEVAAGHSLNIERGPQGAVIRPQEPRVELRYHRVYDMRCDLPLRSGREITLMSLDQQMTYAGLMEGVPDTVLNDMLIESAVQEAARVGARPYLVSPPRRDYMCQPGDMRDVKERSPHRTPEWLPKVRCTGFFEHDQSVLPVVWFQDEYALPISAPALQQLQMLDWGSLATSTVC